jgi:hypothetical protein
MRTKSRTLVALVMTAALLLAGGDTRADVASDRSAAILIFPRILAPISGAFPPNAVSVLETDTLVQITNTTNDPVRLHCFYVDATSRCSISGVACGDGFLCPFDQDLCLPSWIETDFDVHLTPQQPLAWKVTTGLGRDLLPLDGVDFVGPQGDSNAGTSIPPVPRHTVLPDPIPFVRVELYTGELKCLVVDASGRGIANNAIKGEASIVTHFSAAVEGEAQQQFPLVEKYNAIGIQAIEGDANGDDVLELGGDANEYNGCPNVLIVNHFFDTISADVAALTPPDLAGAVQAAPLQSDEILPRFSELTLVPCSEDLRLQVPGSTVAQFLVFNEFEQRFSTSRLVDCYFRRSLSEIDTSQPELSIFNAFVAGTAAGQTRVRGVTGGLLGVLSEAIAINIISEPPFGLDNAANLHFQGDRATADRIVLP